MAEATKAAQPKPTQPKTAAELMTVYERLAKECATLAAERPKILREIEAKVKAEIGKRIAEFDEDFAKIKAEKKAAFVAWETKAKEEAAGK